MPTATPRLGLLKPTVGADFDAWGAMWNSNADLIDQIGTTIGPMPSSPDRAPLWWDTTSGQLFVRYDDGTSTQWVVANNFDATSLYDQFLPISGGDLSGLLTLGGTGYVLKAPNGLGIVSDFQGSGIPAFLNEKPMIFARSVTHAADFADFRFQRDTTFTGGSGNISANVRVLGNYGAGDASENWNLVSSAYSIGPGFTVGAFVNATRNPGGTGGIIGAVINGGDATGNLNSLVSGVVGLEVDVEAQGTDNGVNTAMYGGVGNRVVLNMVAIRHNGAVTTPMTEFAAGLWFSATTLPPTPGDPYSTYLSLIGCGVNTQAYQALDTRGAIKPSSYADPFAALRMSNGQIVDFNGGASLKSNAGNYLQYVTSGTPRLRYMAGATEAFSVSNAGVLDTAQMTIHSAVGSWSSLNAGKQLLIADVTIPNHPAIAFADAFGGNLLGIINESGTLRFAAMPAYTDSTTAPVPLLNLKATGSTGYGHWTFDGGIALTGAVASGPTDLAKHIDLFSGLFGFNITSGALNYQSAGAHNFYIGGTLIMFIDGGGAHYPAGRLPNNAANDAAAASAGVTVGGIYRNGSVLMIRTV